MQSEHYETDGHVLQPDTAHGVQVVSRLTGA